MSKMGEELEKRLDENKYELYEVLKMLSKHRGLYGRLSDHDRDVMNEVIAKVEGV